MTRTNYVAAQDALAKLKEIAAKDLGGKPDDYDIDGTKVFAKGNPSKSLTYGEAAQARHRARRQVRRPRAAGGHQSR